MRTTFTHGGLRGGVWQGILHADKAPGRLLLVQNGVTAGVATVTPAGNDSFHVSVPLPADRLSDGVHTFILIADDGQGDDAQGDGRGGDGPMPGAERLGVLPIVAGYVLEEDLRAQLELLRAEVDLLKRELRRLAQR